ncbi:pentapeptide repeat-containing protein [Microbispora rosea]|uniref:pentapeptide repeat-containing protein n=1 Tax=Microbispora rosea TaxID=58117 RepID=UPI0037A85EC1
MDLLLTAWPRRRLRLWLELLVAAQAAVVITGWTLVSLMFWLSGQMAEWVIVPVLVTVIIPPVVIARRRERRRERSIPVVPAAELAMLSPREREELRIQQEGLRIQRTQARTAWVSGIGVVLGVGFTAFGLFYTARTLEATQESQITDRYTRAIEQLGNRESLDVRLGAIYALERLAQDSTRDHRTIYDVLAAFVREHDPAPKSKVAGPPTSDIQVALTVIARRDVYEEDEDVSIDLRAVRAPEADLSGAHLSGAYLYNADLNGADLSYSDLSGARLDRTILAHADIIRVDLTKAHLNKTVLAKAKLGETDLSDADLRGADLRGTDMRGTDNCSPTDRCSANFSGADLRGADMRGADMRSVDLHGADLRGADLRGADLRGMRGIAPAELRKIAKTDATTWF